MAVKVALKQNADFNRLFTCHSKTKIKNRPSERAVFYFNLNHYQFPPMPPLLSVRLVSSSTADLRWRAAFTWLLPKR